jgi:hypothetical protein
MTWNDHFYDNNWSKNDNPKFIMISENHFCKEKINDFVGYSKLRSNFFRNILDTVQQFLSFVNI